VVAQRHGSVTALLIVASAVQMAQLVAAAVCWPLRTTAGPVFERPSPAFTVSLLRRAFPFAVAGLVVNVQERLAPLMLGRLSSIGEVALFGAAWRIAGIVRMVPQAAFGGALPVLTQASESARSRTVASRFDRVLSVSAAVAAVALAVFAGPIVRLAYGADYESAAPTVMCVAIGLWPFLVNSGRKVRLYAAGRERDAVRWSAVALAIQVAACATLVPRFGAAGAAFAMAAGESAVWWPLRPRR
jgi:O-antigen/teichoic acid export membrane protein